MQILPKNLYLQITNFKNRYPSIFFVTILIFLITLIFIFLPYFTRQKLNKDEIKINKQEVEKSVEFFEGRVVYSGKEGTKVIYDLQDSSGKIIATLVSNDARLEMVEGLRVKIYGTLIKGNSTKKDSIIVKEVILQNVSN